MFVSVHRESKPAACQSSTTEPQSRTANTSVHSADGDDAEDDDIEIIEEVKIQPAVKQISAGTSCYAVKNGDLWKRGQVIDVISSKTGKEMDEVR